MASWHYEIAWLPGKDNAFKDATSRRPHLGNDEDDDNPNNLVAMINTYFELDTDDSSIQCYAVTSAKRSLINNVVALTWKRLQQATFDKCNP